MRTRVTASDGVRLAVDVSGPDTGPTLVCVHGYPDNARLWDGVIAALPGHLRVVTYDVRGAGDSDKPRTRDSYDLDQLADDLRAVIDSVAPGAAVHLLAHDWGSIQTWHALTGPWLRGRVASYTSISGPCLEHAAHWLRSAARDPRRWPALLRQVLSSAYIGFFHLPVLPESAWRTGLAAALVRRRDPAEPAPVVSDAVHGLELYRRNLRPRRPVRPVERPDFPVQVLAPRHDPFVGTPLQTGIERWVPDLRVRRVTGRHWVVRSAPERIAAATAELVEYARGGTETRSLRISRVGADRRRFDGHLVVVTGAGGGIGRATAVEFARHGARLVLADVDTDALGATARLVEDTGSTASTHRVDVGDAHAMRDFAATVRLDYGAPDVVVNNAGIGLAGSALATTDAEWRRLLDVNLWGVLHGSRLFAEQQVDRGEGGHIVNVASMAAYLPNPVLPAYSTVKAAVLMFSECLRAELAPHGIGVSAVCPGFVDTGIVAGTRFAGTDDEEQRRRRGRAQRFYSARNARPESVARDVVRAVGFDLAVVTPTAEAKAARVLSRWAPGLLRAALRARRPSG